MPLSVSRLLEFPAEDHQNLCLGSCAVTEPTHESQRASSQSVFNCSPSYQSTGAPRSAKMSLGAVPGAAGEHGKTDSPSLRTGRRPRNPSSDGLFRSQRPRKGNCVGITCTRFGQHIALAWKPHAKTTLHGNTIWGWEASVTPRTWLPAPPVLAFEKA